MKTPIGSYIYKILLIFSILVLSSTGFKGLKSKKFNVEILQDGHPVQIKDNMARLKKKEFQLRITLKNQEGVFMINSFGRDYFELGNNEPFEHYSSLDVKTIAENNFNADRELYIDSNAASYLFYGPKLDWHRFDKDIKVKKGKVIGIKTVDKVYVEDNMETFDINEIDNDIYLFFVATEEWELGSVPKELCRLKIHIIWL